MPLSSSRCLKFIGEITAWRNDDVPEPLGNLSQFGGRLDRHVSPVDPAFGERALHEQDAGLGSHIDRCWTSGAWLQVLEDGAVRVASHDPRAVGYFVRSFQYLGARRAQSPEHGVQRVDEDSRGL